MSEHSNLGKLKVGLWGYPIHTRFHSYLSHVVRFWVDVRVKGLLKNGKYVPLHLENWNWLNTLIDHNYSLSINFRPILPVGQAPLFSVQRMLFHPDPSLENLTLRYVFRLISKRLHFTFGFLNFQLTHGFLGSAYLSESSKPFHVLLNKFISTLHVCFYFYFSGEKYSRLE